MARRKCWAETVGGYGYRVRVYESQPGGILYLRWWEGGKARKQTLRHRDRHAGVEAAKAKAAALMVRAHLSPRLTIGELFALYEAEVSAHKKGRQPKEDARRIALWTTTLGKQTEVQALDYGRLDAFVRTRRTKVSPGTVGADIIFLLAVLNWATRKRVGRHPLLSVNPVQHYPVPKTPKPLRPVATEDRFEALLAHADVDPQGLFGPFLTIINGTGWRVSAVCQLRASDFDFTTRTTAPFGRLRKRAETDKRGVFQWVPISDVVRDAARQIIRDRQLVGDAWLFPKQRARTKPWDKKWAHTLLVRAEEAAEIEHLPRGGFHAFRRKWVVERKHLPDADVAEAAGYADTRTLKAIYQQADELTLLQVVTDPTQLREAK